MLLRMDGGPKAAVDNLIFHGKATLNGKLIETAHMLLHRRAEIVTGAQSLNETVQDLRTHSHTHSTQTALGEQKRQAGGFTLRTGGAAPKAPNTLA